MDFPSEHPWGGHLRALGPGVLGCLRLWWEGAGPGQVLQNHLQPRAGPPWQSVDSNQVQGLREVLDFLRGELVVVCAGCLGDKDVEDL